MHEISEPDLILYYYGEAADMAAIEQRLLRSSADRKRYDELRQLLDATREVAVPEPPPDYGEQLWQKLQPQLAELKPRPWWHGQRRPQSTRQPAQQRWMRLVAAVAVVAVAAFWLGRQLGPIRPGVEPGVESHAAEAILVAALAEHLQSSSRLLVELSNSAENDGERDLEVAIERADDLLVENRLYRLASSDQASAGLITLLDALERLLLDLRHASAANPEETLEQLRQRIDSEDLLFKLRVSSARLGSFAARDSQGKKSATSKADV